MVHPGTNVLVVTAPEGDTGNPLTSGDMQKVRRRVVFSLSCNCLCFSVGEPLAQ
jgi:hypothetical protein